MSCEHHKTCGDCFSSAALEILEKSNAAVTREYAKATEINLATLDELISIKSSSERRIDRQKSICFDMLLVCNALRNQISWADHNGASEYARARDLLFPQRNITAALDAWVENLRKAYRT